MADTKLQSLTEIFNQKFFRIPDFQRGYSWEEEHLEAFWEDLMNLKGERIHYTGLLTVEPVNKKQIAKMEKWQDDLWLFDRGFSAFYIIDGQQRLTTSIILINQILQQFKDNEGINFDTKANWINRFLFLEYGDTYKSYVFGYEKDDPSDEYFKTKILEQKSLFSDKVPEHTLYTANLSFAKEFFNQKLTELKKNDLQELFKKVVNRFKFNYYEIDDELDVYVTFETMNNRGKKLSNLELLKNRLIYLSTLFDIDETTINRLRKDINNTWKTIYEYLGKNKDNELNDDYFLKMHWIMYFTYDRSEEDSYAKFLLNEKFTATNVISKKLELKEIQDYISSLHESVKIWFYLYNPEFSSYSDILKEWIQKLNRLGMAAFPPLFMAAFLNKKNKEETIVELFKAAERFIFLVFRLTQRPSNTRNNHFYRLANILYWGKDYFNQGKADLKKIIGDIDWNTDGESGEDEDFEYHGYFDLGRFEDYINELFKKESGYYAWNGLRYFLFEYELHLQEQSKGNQKVSWIDFNKRKREDSIEHIYPQTPTDESWKKPFKDLKKNEKTILLNSLGNLVLLAQSKNSELQNKPFAYKCRHKNSKGIESGYFNGSYSEIAVSTYKKWTPEEILDRSLKMMKFMEERWDFSIDEWEDITAHGLLNLEFLLSN